MKKILLTLSLIALVKLTNAQNYFYPAANYTTSTYPFSVTSADFNGDNHPDVASANRGSNNISVILNTGAGTFTTGVTYTVGSVPVGIAAADFNNDNHNDIVTCNNFDNTISILTNTGTGTFTASATYTVGTSPTAVATADFNSDNHPDIAVVNNGTNNISILLNTGTGTFAAPVNYPAGNSPYRITIADFNGDNKPDMAVSSYGDNKVAVLLNTGTGTFSPQATYTAGVQPYGISSGDFNADGKADIAVANLTTGGVISVLVNSGTGTFGAPTSYTVGGQSYDVTTADFNADGKTDIAIADYNDNSVAVLANTGSGTFASQSNYSVEINPTALSTADFNNDGKADIASANSNSNSVSILNSFIPAAALNFDGVNDYVYASSQLNNVFTFEASVNWTGSTATSQAIVSNGKTGATGYTLMVDKANANKLSVNVSSVTTMQSTAHLTIGTWQKVSVVYNGTTWVLYLDGVAYTLTNNTSVPHPIIGGNFNVGCDYNATKTFNGSIDEVRFWSRALCKEEIQNNLTGELSLPQNGLLVYYKFNQGVANASNSTITTLTDATGNNNATISSFALTGTTSNFVAPGAVTTGSTAAAFTNTLSAVATQTDVSTCYGDANGSASVAVTGIESPFTYTWSAGGNTNTATGLTNGNYTCTIANGCGTIAQTFTIIAPAPLFATSTANTIPCYGGIATATVLASGGTQISGGGPTPIYNGIGSFTITAGTHTFTVTDAHNCAATTTLTTNNPTIVTPTVVSVQNVSCFGSADGAVTINSTGGSPPYNINNPTTNLTAGDYTFTVTDGYNCPATTTLTITQPTQLIASSTSGTIACNGGVTTVTVTETGGTSPYTNDGLFTNITAGSYSYTVMDDNGCISTTTITVNQPNVLIVSQILVNNVICYGGSDANADVTVIGGTTPYTYAWLPNTTQTTNTVTNLSAQSYTCNITDANLCNTGTTFTVTQPNPIDTSLTATLIPYPAITANAIGATYQWLDCNGSTLAPISGATQQTYTVPGYGSYAVIITEGACSDTSECRLMDLEGISKYSATNNLQVYPNPFSNELTITSTAKTNAILFDMLGNKINEFVLQNTTQTISLGDLAPGMYYLQVDAQKIKIIKQ